MDVVALRIQTRVLHSVWTQVKETVKVGSVQTMAEFGGRIARGHLERLADLGHTLLVAGGVNYGSSCMAASN